MNENDRANPGSKDELLQARALVKEYAESAGPRAAYMKFRLSVLDATIDGMGAGGAVLPAPPAAAEAEMMARGGIALLDPDAVAACVPDLAANALALAGIMEEAGVEGGAELGKALCGPDRPRHETALFVARALASRDSESMADLGRKIGIRPSLLRFAAAVALRPGLGKAAERLSGSVRQDLWMRGWCPICGSHPDAGRLDRTENGARFLHCPSCGFQWRYLRIACPFCGNGDHASMRIFYCEDDSPYRIAACLKCSGYVKEIDERKLPEGKTVNMAAEEILTLDLDLAAEEEGFSNG